MADGYTELEKNRQIQSGIGPDVSKRTARLASEVEVRELFYSHVGGFDSSRVVEGLK